ncbi:hypothetical protein Goshw_022260 [Gossypium schwendimanii]|uniref:VQ domain-containing protein n=2 Tax=Gossypium TaxID=3633 RepID=A0A7J9KTR2_GOSSC|nr:hypothetical protein [Gossypium lobatum]MBA0849895.1 hypothetical protein [Gossypium schwendimanii]
MSLIKHSIRGRSELQGPRPSPLKVSHSSSLIKKASHGNIRNRINSSSSKVINPVVIYLRSPKIIHVRPEEFMSLVQRLTGKDSSSRDESCHRLPSSSSSSWNMAAAEPAKVTKRTSSGDNLFDAEMSKLAFNGVEHGDQILELSPTWLRFLAYV